MIRRVQVQTKRQKILSDAAWLKSLRRQIVMPVRPDEAPVTTIANEPIAIVGNEQVLTAPAARAGRTGRPEGPGPRAACIPCDHRAPVRGLVALYEGSSL